MTAKILVVWPPQVPSYFNAGHHLHVFSVAAYLRDMFPSASVVARDYGCLNAHWKRIGDDLYTGQFDVIAVANDYDAIDDLPRFLHYVSELSPHSSVVTFGRLSFQVPDFFESLSLDGIVESGDYEAGVESFLRYLDGGGLPAGVRVNREGRWVPATRPGDLLTPDRWVLPDVREIPYSAYERLYIDDSDKFCGIPERRELVVPVARGCPVGCGYCEIPLLQGRRERRLEVRRAADYIEQAFALDSFEYISFYAPTFTLRRQWVLDLLLEWQRRGHRYAWKCATTLYHLDEDLVKAMAAGGCVRISVGLESLEVEALELLPAVKHEQRERFENVSRWCAESDIELNCFIIVGLPGTTTSGTAATIQQVRAAGARVRPTVYAPYHEMPAQKSIHDLSMFNRQLLVGTSLDPSDRSEVYGLFFRREETPTQVHRQIPPAMVQE